MPFAYWCVLAAAILPLVWVSYAKFGAVGDNRHPREQHQTLPPRKRRAYAAHQNAYENFPFFAAAVIVAVTMEAPLAAVNGLAAAYLAARVAHGLLYIADRATARSAIYAAGFFINVAIFVLPAVASS